MTDETVTVLCGTCKVAVNGPADPKPQDTLTCPKCGRRDNFQNVMRSVERYTTDFLEKEFGKSLERSMRGNKFVKVTGKRVPHRSYAFITNMRF